LGYEIIIAAVSGAAGAFGGIHKAYSNAQERLGRRFEKIENELDALRNTVMHDYVLKEDFLREMQAVHNKLDRILDFLIKNPYS